MTPTQQKELSYSTQQRESSFNTGKVKTGCPNTPELKSRFCTLHKPTAAIPQEIQLTDVPAQASTSTSSQRSASEDFSIRLVFLGEVTNLEMWAPQGERTVFLAGMFVHRRLLC